ncbi:MAG TPA: VOC family protein [Pyrinomonadaceae bacterium]|nr:VOC family protein [Pyrinomonadaceae bacterium]
MPKRVVPMIHVPNVRATVEWYESLGFEVLDTYDDGGDGLSFAVMSFGEARVMFNSGGQPSVQRRREVDLYVYCDKVDEVFDSLKDRVEVVERLNDKFYGMREFIIRDLNRFWVTFGQQITQDEQRKPLQELE